MLDYLDEYLVLTIKPRHFNQSKITQWWENPFHHQDESQPLEYVPTWGSVLVVGHHVKGDI